MTFYLDFRNLVTGYIKYFYIILTLKMEQPFLKNQWYEKCSCYAKLKKTNFKTLFEIHKSCTDAHIQRKTIWQDIPQNIHGYCCVVELQVIVFSFFYWSAHL